MLTDYYVNPVISKET